MEGMLYSWISICLQMMGRILNLIAVMKAARMIQNWRQTLHWFSNRCSPRPPHQPAGTGRSTRGSVVTSFNQCFILVHHSCEVCGRPDRPWLSVTFDEHFTGFRARTSNSFVVCMILLSCTTVILYFFRVLALA